MVRRVHWIVLALLFAIAGAGRSDILRWDNGKVIPGTEGITPGPGVNLRFKDLRFAALSNFNLSASHFAVANLANADLHGANLADAFFQNATLSNADLSEANLTGAYLEGARLTHANLRGADLTRTYLYGAYFSSADLMGAIVAGANFESATSRGFTSDQLYSTASYQSRNLRGIGLGTYPYGPIGSQISDLSDWNFSSQDLTGANFYNATLERTDFSDANLTDAVFQKARLANTNLFGATVTGADLGSTSHGGLTKE